MINKQFYYLAALLFVPFTVFAADAIQGEVSKQSVNPTAITMFLLFVSATLGITYWAAKRTKSTNTEAESTTASKTGKGPAALTAGSTPNGPAATAKYAMKPKVKQLMAGAMLNLLRMVST